MTSKPGWSAPARTLGEMRGEGFYVVYAPACVMALPLLAMVVVGQGMARAGLLAAQMGALV